MKYHNKNRDCYFDKVMTLITTAQLMKVARYTELSPQSKSERKNMLKLFIISRLIKIRFKMKV